MENKKSRWLEVGTVLKSKKGGSYIKIKEDVTLKAGTILQVEDPRETLQKMVSNGKMDQQKAQERIAKIPEYVLKTITLPPQDNQ